MLDFVNWPLAVVVIAVFALLLFKKQIARLIDRITGVSKAGIVASNVPQESGAAPKPSNVAEFLKKTFDNALVVELEDTLTKQVDSLNPASDSERSKLLLRFLAGVIIVRNFDSTYYRIYGSQILALQYLNDGRGLAIPTTDLHHFYESAKNADPTLYGDYAFEGWLKFIETSVLIRRDGDNVTITVRGTEFLKYLIEQGYTFRKRG
jgi:hypothetical protein